METSDHSRVVYNRANVGTRSSLLRRSSRASFIFGRRLSVGSVTYVIHNTLIDAGAEIDRQLGKESSVAGGVAFELNGRLVDDFDSLCSEMEHLDEFEAELQQELFVAETEWKETSGCVVESCGESDEEATEPTTLSSQSKEERQDADSVAELEDLGDDDFLDDSSMSSDHEDHLQGFEYQVFGMNLGLAADVLAARMQKKEYAAVRILPSYLRRHFTTSKQNGATDTGVWNFGVPVVGSASTTGKMLLFHGHFKIL